MIISIYRCKKCNYIYDNNEKDKPFEELDEEEFKCPKCRSSKKFFVRKQAIS
ncbi:MAG: hypothetical protein ACFE9S_09940 [Candidatus Hermodarchaeota archaeon]